MLDRKIFVGLAPWMKAGFPERSLLAGVLCSAVGGPALFRSCSFCFWLRGFAGLRLLQPSVLGRFGVEVLEVECQCGALNLSRTGVRCLQGLCLLSQHQARNSHSKVPLYMTLGLAVAFALTFSIVDVTG